MLSTRLIIESKTMVYIMIIFAACVFTSGCSVGAFHNLNVKIGTNLIRVEEHNFHVFAIAALNTGDEDIKLKFPSGMQFDFVVTSGDVEIWRWSHDKAAITMLTEVEIRKDELTLHSVVWDGVNIKGEQVAPGTYGAFGEILTKPRIKTELINFYWPGN